MRERLEPRFQRDFAAVRVHDDARAARSAATIDAAAYSSGSHVVFGRDAWSPHTPRGLRLIAHELAHVAQQPRGPATGDHVLGHPADPAEPEAQTAGDRAVAGSQPAVVRPTQRGVIRRQTAQSTYLDTVNAASIHTTGDTTEGTVRRQEFDTAHKSIHDATARVRTRFSSDACEVSVPFNVQFQPTPTAADLSASTTVAGQATPSALPAARSRTLFDRFLRIAREQLNGWFNLHIGPCPHQECANRDIPIGVDVREVTSNPQLTVAIVGGEGRSYVSSDRMVLIGDDASDDRTIGHEVGHAALGAGDEYLERTLPGRSPQRVRDRDMSRMNDQAYRQAVFHERHFAFVPDFVSHVINRGRTQPCAVTMSPVGRAISDVRLELQGGYANVGGVGGVSLSGGLNLGLLTRDSARRFSIGPQATMLAQLSGPYRTAFLLGLRLGLEQRSSLPHGGLSYGAHVEGGASLSGVKAPYVEGGGRLGYSFGLSPTIISVFTEAAAGTTINPSDPEALRYFRLGFGGSTSF